MKIVTIVILILTLVFVSNTVFSQWTYNTNKPAKDFCLIGDTLLIASSNKIYKSTNGGDNWILVQTFPFNVNSIMHKNFGYTFVGTGRGLYRTSNLNTPFQRVITPDSNCYVTSLAFTDHALIVGTGTNGIYRSTNNGANWDLPWLADKQILYLARRLNGVSAFAATNNGLYRTLNEGTTWELISGTENKSFKYVEYLNLNNFMASFTSPTSGSIYSTNGGNNWINHSALVVNCGYAESSNIILGTDNGGVRTLNISNMNYIQIRNQGLPNAPVISLGYWRSTYVFCSSNDTIWRTPISYVGIKQISSGVPSNFSLSQNYPNPFNPTTNIRYQIPKESVVTIKIFDITGKEIETLLNEKVSPGTYETNWNASRYSSGVYFYKLESGYFSEVKKMILAK